MNDRLIKSPYFLSERINRMNWIFSRFIRKPGIKISHGLFAGWVEHLDIFCLGFVPQPNLASHFCAISETQQNGRR
jgi:hypothetical protein